MLRALPGASGVATGTAPGTGTSDDISTQFYPVVDGVVLPSHPFDPVAPALSADIPVLTGSDETEGIPYGDPDDPYWTTEITTPAALRDRVKAILRVQDADADQLIAIYRGNRPAASLSDIAAIITGDNSGSRQSSRLIAERKAAQGRAPAYHYYFKWRSPVRGGKLRSMHSMELPFLWDHVDLVAFLTGTGPERAALASAMSTAFTSFARTGIPSVPGVAAWAPYDSTRRATMVFDTQTSLVDDPYGAERRALDLLRLRNG
jgi:para-nitrobenzyl esterase